LENSIDKKKPEFFTREWISVAIPLMLIESINIILKRTDILMLGAMAGSKTVGIYAAAVRISGLLTFGLASLNMIAAPMISQLYASKKHVELQQMLSFSAKILAVFAFPLTLVTILFGKWMLGFFGIGFDSAYTALVILVAGQLINTLSGSVGLLMAMTGHQNQSAFIMGVCFFINILLNLVFISYWGINGAALATSLSAMLWNILLLIYIRKNIDLDPTLLFLFKKKKLSDSN
jgi:O-antigen/teichoic acid export membrane protein